MRVRGRHLGDTRLRIEPRRRAEFRNERLPRRRRPLPAPIVLVAGFTGLIAIGTVLLALPVSTASGQPTPLLDALFTATSAVCVTGLVVVDTATYWSGFGQLVILLLVQIGGFGFMTSSTLLLLLVVRRRTRLRDRVLVQESIGSGELGNVTGFVKRIALFTLLAEGIGAVVLTLSYATSGDDGLSPLWFGVFHSISAFNNAGFDVTGGFRSLTGFADDYVVLTTIGLLIIFGGLGYAIVEDVVRNRSWKRLALETKMVVLTTIALIGVGALLVGALEWNNAATLGGMPDGQKILNATFKSVTSRTAGFNAIDNAALVTPAAMVVMALMFIGGASGSTAGGIKVTTFSVLLIAIVSTAIGRPSAEAFGRRIPHLVVYRALAVALLAIAFVFLASLALATVTSLSLLDVAFETVSAFATVGLSRNVTPGLPDEAQLILMIAMFIGRIGPLTVVLALTARSRPVAYRHAVESVRIG
jgi:trk system potassium uptake protein TrkH